MSLKPPAGLTPDARLLFATRILRMFAYGLLSVILALYLAAVGLSTGQIGALLSLTLLGDTVVSFWMTTSADRIGRRKMLLAGAALMLLAGLVFAFTQSFVLLIVAAIVGVISPSGNEVGPFLSIEQAALSETVSGHRRTAVFAWYNLAGSFAGALGALAGGGLAQSSRALGFTDLAGYRVVVLAYAALGLVLALLFLRVSPSVEVPGATSAKGVGARPLLGLHESQAIIVKLSALFALDAFAGGFIMQSLIAYWFHLRFGVGPALLG